MTPKPLIRASLAAILGAVALAAFGAPAASASSIVYVKDGNVWISSPDATTSRQLTSGGNWHSPTQADDGTVAAVQGADSPITIMNGYGQVLRTLKTPAGAATSNGSTFAARPINLDYSPDGSKIAYEYATSTCPPASSCGARDSAFYTWADHETPVSEFGNQFNRGDPSWITNNRALVFGGFGGQVNIDDIGGGDYSTVHWFDDIDLNPDDSTDLGDGELSRQRDRLVTVRGYGSSTTIQVYKVNGDPATAIPPAPDPACFISDPNPTFDDPTWSPDGRQLAFATTAGLFVGTFPTVAAGDCAGADVADNPTIAGASQPDWGPANVLTGNPPQDPMDPVDPDDPASQAACEKALAKVDAAKAKVREAKKSGKSRKIAKAKAKLKKAKQAASEACA